ncbi:hypothetical protein TVAG_173610 [Trichomonas vaginalis G3]|uniref:RING-type domain-containing protein n=1 Tax=Trichomonas vaginalis (strain ATCC PRA-98 / G3) TaxID=412133 RepID=A2EVI4_TRIV3|nr:nuclear localization sequence binding [Trichomonas vaginalis G3]EAY03316.1 hypothetical protein TVAG_173610 [Trichomonas vaginalis G3]KAI5498345.1 nuclear localization sequence binding [Trichomonas vaginalis G3]|eukprot:XP_001315539.1 hypothetical protein [Trichomonas vaginalis G3]
MTQNCNKVCIQSVEKGVKTSNFIHITDDPSSCLVCIQGLRLYYTPPDVCKFVNSFHTLASNCLVLLTDKSPTFTIILKAISIDSAKELLKKLKANPTPICSLDTLTYDFVQSFEFESQKLQLIVNRFSTNEFYDNNCAICLYQLVSDLQLITFPCGHSMHTTCAQRMKQWECPLCRYAPISSLSLSPCEVCGTFDRPYICLSCARSFCYDHALEHFKNTGHGYCASADGRETWNLMSGTTMQRIAIDKSGEYVELCAKEDVLKSYLESALYEQLNIHREIECQETAAILQSAESELTELDYELAEKRKKLESMKKLIQERKTIENKLKIATTMLEKFQEKEKDGQKLKEQLLIENEKLRNQIRDQEELISDMQTTASITAAAVLGGKNKEVHIKFNQK